MGKNSLQMPSARRSRGVFLTALILILVVAYYLDVFSVLVGRERKHEITPPLKDAVQHVVPEEQTSESPVPATISLNTESGSVSQEATTTLLEFRPSHQSSISSLEITPTPTTTPLLDIVSTPTSTQQPSSKNNSISPSDVLLIFKTGASTIWRRMPLHLSTTLSNPLIPHSVIYSDLTERLSPTILAIDILSNVSSLIKAVDPPAHSSYLSLQSPHHQNTYHETARLPGDEPPDSYAGNQPGWLLDKYKFLPMLEHAATHWPEKKWYVYIEDDTFIFWENVLWYLSTLGDSDGEMAYYGAFSGVGNETFAQGGSGLIFSGSLMRGVFGGGERPGLERYGNETSKSCCGDIMLGKVLRDFGVRVNRGGWGTGSFRPEPAWKTGFEGNSWCRPVFTFHHVHQRDLVMLSEVERKVMGTGRPVIFRDVFMELVAPYLKKPMMKDWDNFSWRWVLSGNSTLPSPEGLEMVNATVLTAGTSSPEGCQEACLAVPDCMGWKHDSAKQECGLDTVVKLGREPDPQPSWEEKTVITSGWMLERIDDLLLKNKCEVVLDP